MIQFHETRMGHRFIESTMPALVAQLTKLNDNLAKSQNVTEIVNVDSRKLGRISQLKRIAEIFVGLERGSMTVAELKIHVVVTGVDANAAQLKEAEANTQAINSCIANRTDSTRD